MSKVNQIIELLRLKAGSYSDIARTVGVSRQRVHQIAKREGLEILPGWSIPGYMPTTEAMKVLGYRSQVGLWSAIKAGKVAARRIGNRLYIPTKGALLTKCVICGAGVPRGRKITCSDICCKVREYQVHKRGRWRALAKKFGKKVPPSADYIRRPR